MDSIAVNGEAIAAVSGLELWRFRLDSDRVDGLAIFNGSGVEYPSIQGREYRLLGSDDLRQWEPAGDWLLGDGDFHLWESDFSKPSYFWSVASRPLP
jgi:hypothetical protein